MRQNGFVLVNALLLVAALSAAAVLVLSRAELAQRHRSLDQDVIQTQLYLDGFEALAISLLATDVRAGEIDHLGESWAKADYNVPVDRGQLAGQIVDLQGLFNINWLSNSQDVRAKVAFARLAQTIGISPATVRNIELFLSEDGPTDLSAYASQPVPRHPRGGPIHTIEDLRYINGIQDSEFATIRKYCAALPSASPLNVNTAPTEVLVSLLPESARKKVLALVQTRLQSPFESVDEFVALFDGEIVDDEELPPGEEADSEGERFSIQSNWFRADSTASLNGTLLRRRTVFQRVGVVRNVKVAYRLRLKE